MSDRHGWTILTLIVLVAVLLAGCGPQLATPTAGVEGPTETGAAAEETAPAPATEQVDVVPPDDLPVDPDDWRSLGEPDAPVTIVEYSDFQ